MKAIEAKNYGGSEVLSITHSAPLPQLTPAHVLVKIQAASLNPFDISLLSGVYKEHMPLTFPATVGGDFSGVVTEIAKDVTHVAVGDEVYGTANSVSGGSGSFAEYASVSQNTIAKKPTTISFVDAAGFPLVGSSAVQALEEHINLQPAQTILIHGGAGGIGHIAIQLAKSIGARVIVTAGTPDLAFVKNLGADEVIDYKTQQFETLVKDVDAVFDTVGGEVTNRSLAVLKKGGILVSMKGPPDEALTKQCGVIGIGQGTKNNTAHLTRLKSLIEAGNIHIHIERVFILQDIKEAWELQQKHPQGKLVLTI